MSDILQGQDPLVGASLYDQFPGCTVTVGSSHQQPQLPQQDISSGAEGRTQYCCKRESGLKFPVRHQQILFLIETYGLS